MAVWNPEPHPGHIPYTVIASFAMEIRKDADLCPADCTGWVFVIDSADNVVVSKRMLTEDEQSASTKVDGVGVHRFLGVLRAVHFSRQWLQRPLKERVAWPGSWVGTIGPTA